MVRWPNGYGAGPIYLGGRAPANLRTRRQLRADGLSAAGLRPAGWLQYNPHHAVCALYDPAAARPVRPLTDRQRAALALGRVLANTAPCSRCEEVRVPWRPGWEDSTWLGKPLCERCLPIAEQQAKEAQARRWAAQAEAFRRQLAADHAATSRWAGEVLADPAAVVLDTETTGLGAAYMVEIAIVAADGRVLLDTLVNPQEPIPAETTAIHGITDDMVRDAPTFPELLPRITEVLCGARVVIYNADFDTEILRTELCRHWHPDRHAVPDPTGYVTYRFDEMNACREQLDAWMATVPADVQCAMTAYAAWHGEWHDYFGNYTWQPLLGGHRAAADCRAVLDRLRTMADTHVSTEGRAALSA